MTADVQKTHACLRGCGCQGRHQAPLPYITACLDDHQEVALHADKLTAEKLPVLTGHILNGRSPDQHHVHDAAPGEAALQGSTGDTERQDLTLHFPGPVSRQRKGFRQEQVHAFGENARKQCGRKAVLDPVHAYGAPGGENRIPSGGIEKAFCRHVPGLRSGRTGQERPPERSAECGASEA